MFHLYQFLCIARIWWVIIKIYLFTFGEVEEKKECKLYVDVMFRRVHCITATEAEWPNAPSSHRSCILTSSISEIFVQASLASDTGVTLQLYLHAHTHRLTAFCPGPPRWACTRKVKRFSLLTKLLEQETVSGSGISWTICKSAPCCRQITTPAPHHSVFYMTDAFPATQPTASKHWRQNT